MRKLMLFLMTVLLAVPFGFSQNRVSFTENFNGASCSFTRSPQSAWMLDTTLSVTGKAAWGFVPNAEGDSIELISPVYDLSNYAYAYLRFAHICKVSEEDMVTVEYKENYVGSKWKPIPYLDYKGESSVFRKQRCFHHACYPEWVKNDMTAQPDNSWWKVESFDVSQDVAYAEVQFKFKVKKGTKVGTNFAWGWFIDNFELMASTAQINPPVVQFVAPFTKGTVYGSGPYTIYAKAAKRTIVPLQTPVLRVSYTYLNGTTARDSVMMTKYEGDTIWKAVIPQQLVGTQVSYTVYAADTVGNNNMASSGYIIGREWGFDSNCVALLSIDTPLVGAIAGTQTPVAVTIENRGLVNLTSAKITWSINGVAQTPVNWTGNLNEGFKTRVQLGSYLPAMNSMDTIVAFVSAPNGSKANNTDDTIASRMVYGCASIPSGKYLVDPDSTNTTPGVHHTINEILDAIRICGTSGDIVISLSKGTYYEDIELFDFSHYMAPGSSLVIESATGKAEDVIIAGKTAGTVKLRVSNISNLAVRNITFQGEATGVYFSDTITNVELNGCRVLVDTVTTTTYVGVLAYQGSFNRLRILNNYIEGAYYSMYIYGNSTTDYAKNVTVTGNRMHAAYYYGLYSYYVDYDYVSNNVLTNRTKNASNYFYGLRLYYSDADEVAENRINIAAQYTYGLYTYYFNRDSARTGLVANNEIIMHTTTTAYGAYVYYSNVEYIHNSILALGTPGTAYGVYHGATAGYKVHFYNNLFTCFGKTAYPFYMSAVTTVGNDLLLDYNNYYAPQYLGYAGGARSTLADWITYSKDQNAANVQPAFIDNTVDARCLYYTGMTCPAVQNVPNDILGKPRTGSTAMGCYTPAPVSFDAALLSFADWKGSVVIGQSTPVKVRMMNTGSTLPITAAQVNWTVNGIAQTPYKWTGSLAPYKDTVFSIGGYLPVNGVNNVVAWLSNQNGIAAGDSVPDNDTIRNYAFGCKAAMGGTYRIGKDANADFATPELALTMLSYCGLNAPVVLMLDSGTYDPLSISGNFQGISGKNTVTITSATGKASDVVFTNGSPVITFDQGANHFRLDRVTVDGTSSTYGIYVGSATSDIRITHCQINMDLLSSATTYGIYCTTNTRRDSIWLIGNHVDGGYYNVYFYNGTSSNSTDHGRYHIIDSNLFTNPYYECLYSYYSDIMSISHNQMIARKDNSYNYFYGISTYYGNHDIIAHNRVDGYRDWTDYSYGMYIMYSNYTYSQNATDTTYVINNEVRVKAKNTPYGMYIGSGRYVFAHNSVYSQGSSTAGYGIYGYSSTSGYKSDFINNNVVMIGCTSAYPIYAYTSPTYSTFRGNNYYHQGSTNLLYNGGGRTSLSAVKNYDATATNVLPEFIDLNLGLFVRKSANSGIDCPLSHYALVDLNSENRTNPTIRGCYNASVLTYNASLMNFTNPAVGTAMNGTQLPVSVTLYNRGDSTITSADVYWEVNGVSQTVYKWSGSLGSDKTVSLNLGSFTAVNGSNVIKAYVHLNDSKDVLPLDDTISTSVFGCSTGALSGTYTVGGTGANFNNLEDAVTAVTKCGIGGPVLFKMAKGTYNSVAFNGAFPGGSYSNNVTFTSASGNSEDVVIYGGGESYALDLKDVSNLHFSNVTIGDSMLCEQAIVVENAMKNVTFTNCNIYAIAGVSSTTYAGVYRPTSTSYKIDTLRFTKCNFYGGYQNIHLYYGGTSSDDGHLIIEDCKLHGAIYYGFNCPYPGYYVLTALRNDIHNHYKASTYYGFRIGSVTSYLNIDSLKYNRVLCDASGTNYGFYVGQTVNYHGQLNKVPAKIHNNEFIIKGTTGYGINYQNLSCFDFRHNTFYVSSSSTRYGYYLTNTSTGYTNNFYDNLVYLQGTSGTAHCLYHSSGVNYFTTAYFTADYNNYYDEMAGNIGHGITDVNTWYLTTGNELNSLTEEVYFKSVANRNMHTNGAHAIIPVDPEVKIDLEGKPRVSYTNAGCYNDFIPSNYDAGVNAITAPVNGAITGATETCKVKVRNMGKLALKTVVIKWMVNGVVQTPYMWQAATAADTITYGGITPEIAIGTFKVPAGKYRITVWTEDPNGISDLNKANDTLEVELIACLAALKGTYTIGGSNADFDTPDEAVTALTSCGINGPVVFKMASGNYDPITFMGEIPGASDTSTVTFISASGNADAVIIGAGASTAMKLAGVSHLVFEKLTIGATGANNSVAVELAGYNEDIFFHNCKLYVSTSTTNSSSRVVNYANTSNTTNYLKDVRFISNEVRGGYYGFYLYYAGGVAANCKTSAAKRASVRMDSNYIYDQYYYPVYSYYYSYVESFSHNRVVSRLGANYNYGAYFYYNVLDSITGNRFSLNTNYSYSGIRLYYVNRTGDFGTDIIPVAVSNNEIICIGQTYAYGFYVTYTCANIVNNSVYCKAPTNYGIYVAAQSSVCDLNIQNNIFVSENGSTTNYLVYVSAAATLTTYPTMFDYNDYFTTGTSKNNFYCGSARTFANWQSTYNLDGHSVQVLPDFRNMPNDMSIGDFSDQLKCNRNRQVLRDINNDGRTSLTIMGAYSTPLFEGYDLQLESYVEPTVGGIQCFPNQTPVKLGIYNMGTYDADFSVNPATLYVKCESDSVNFVKSLTLNKGFIGIMKRDTFEVVTSMDITYSGMYKLTAWLEWSKDQDRSDDTLKLDYYVDKSVLPYDNNFTGQFAGVATNQAYGDISWEVVSSNPVLNPVFGTGSLLFRSSEGRGSISQALFTSVSLQGTYNPHLYFWYAHDNANPYLRDQMEVRISQDGGATFKTLKTLYRYDAKCTTPTWREYKMDLSNYSTGSCIIVAFTAYSYGGGDQTVDRVKFIAQQDMRVLVEAPSDTEFVACDLTGRSLTVYLENLTSQEVPFNDGDSITVEMSGASNFVFKQALTGRLENRETDTLTLSPIDYIGGGQFDVKVYVNAIDSNAANDTAKFSLNLNPDLAVTGYDAIGYTEPGDTVHVGITMKNIGNLDIVSPFDVQVVVNGEDTVTERITSALKAGDTLYYRFSQGIIVPMTTADQPYYLLDVRALLSCDANSDNDSVRIIGNVNIIDNGILSITNPVNGQCAKGGEMAKVEVRLYNNGNVDGTDSLLVVAVIDSAGVTYATLSEKVAPLYAGETRNHSFSQQYRVPRLSVNGAHATYNVVVYVGALEGDIDLSNDTAKVEACVEGGVGVNEALADRWTVGQNVPNPAGDLTRIPYTVPESGMLTLSILGLNGQVLYREEVNAEAGSGSIRVNVSDLAAGIYYYSVEYRGERIVRKMNVTR